jgi:hypothetical protein
MTRSKWTVRRSPSSLVGGIAVAAGVLVLWLLLMRPLSGEAVAAGVVLAAAVGVWVRLANF